MTLFKTSKAANPQRLGNWIIILPGYLSDFIWVEYPKPEETKDELFASLEILVNPSTGEIVKQHFWGQTQISLIYELHADFVMGKISKELGEIGFKVVSFWGFFFLYLVYQGYIYGGRRLEN